ncbi:MAG: hypothetical protein IJH75_05320 [Mogibacterium sp.]|nr:hypothetical protein [Mogibacterium sp.]
MEKADFMAKREKLNAQLFEFLPLIEIERCAYITAEYGRVQSVIGTGYWDKAAGQNQIFHGRMGDDLALIEDRPKDPYDVTIEELWWITTQYKHIERCGTDTYLNFFNMMPEDKKRIKTIANFWHKLTHETPLTDEEIAELRDGHEPFLDRILSTAVKVIR